MLTLREQCINSLLRESPNRLDTINKETGILLISDDELQKMKATTFALVVGAPKLFDDYDVSLHSIGCGESAYTSALAEHAEEVIIGILVKHRDRNHWSILVAQINKAIWCTEGDGPGVSIDLDDETQKKMFAFYGYPEDSDHCFSHYCHRIYCSSKRTFYPD